MSPEKEQPEQHEVVPYPFTHTDTDHPRTVALPEHFIPSSLEKKLTPEQKNLLPPIEKYIRYIVGTINEILENMRAIEFIKAEASKHNRPISILPIHKLTYLAQCALKEAPSTRAFTESDKPTSFEWKGSFLESYKQFSKQIRFVQLVFLALFIERKCNIPLSILFDIENAQNNICHAAGKDLKASENSIADFQDGVQVIRNLLKDVHFSVEEK